MGERSPGQVADHHPRAAQGEGWLRSGRGLDLEGAQIYCPVVRPRTPIDPPAFPISLSAARLAGSAPEIDPRPARALTPLRPPFGVLLS